MELAAPPRSASERSPACCGTKQLKYFADLLNALLFNGEQRVTERDLIAALPRSQMKMGMKIHDQERDSAMYWDGSTFCITLFGLENQSDTDAAGGRAVPPAP